MVTPSFACLIVIVPTDLPTPSTVMRFIVTFIDLAAYAGATNAHIIAATVTSDVFILRLLLNASRARDGPSCKASACDIIIMTLAAMEEDHDDDDGESG